MKILVKPLEGIYWEDKSILLGTPRSNVEKTLTSMQSIDKTVSKSGLSVYLFNTQLRIDFDKNDRVEFIEFLGGFNIKLQVILYGLDAFKTPADQLFDLLKKHNAGEIGDDENGYCYAFKRISIGIWRESTPESLAEFIQEIRTDECIDETIAAENIKIESLKANYWETLGMGVENYYL